MLRALPPICILSFLLPTPAQGQCPAWSDGFGPRGPDGAVLVQLTLELAGSPRLAVGGSFGAVPGAPARNVALFDGSSWSQLGDGLEHTVRALAVFDGGAGPKLWAGGDAFVARLEGSQWQVYDVVGTVRALAAHDDGTGPALWAGGDFFAIDGVQIQAPARFAGAWSGVFPPQAGGRRIDALASHDDGAGPALYLGGTFDSIGGVVARRLARWDGVALAEVGGGIQALDGLGVRALLSILGPGGVPELHVGGDLIGANGVTAPSWIAWRSGAWTFIGGKETVLDLALCRVGGVELVHAARQDRVERLAGGTRILLPLDSPYSRPASVGAFGAGPTQDLHLGLGSSAQSGSGLLRWSGSVFTPLGPGLGLRMAAAGLNVHAFNGYDELVAVGVDPLLGDARALRFDGAQWLDLPPLPQAAAQLKVGLSYAGELYVAGSELPLGPARVWRLAGSTWQAVGPAGSGSFASAFTLATFDDGGGPALYVGGRFEELGASGTKGLAKLVGAGWQSVGGGIVPGAPFGSSDAVTKLVVCDDGGGTALFAGGSFDAIGGVTASHVARWDGSAWSPLGTGVSYPGTVIPGKVQDMVVLEGGGHGLLIVGGLFNSAGGIATASIAAWDGTAWAGFGRGLEKQTPQGPIPGTCKVLETIDLDGSGEVLLVLGDFDLVDGLPADGAAVWDGSGWTALQLDGGFTQGEFSAAAVHDDGTGRALYVSGEFSAAGGVASARIARLRDPCGAIVGIPRCTSNVNSTGEVARIRASGSASLSANALTLSASRLPAGASTIFVLAPFGTQVPFGHGLRCVGGSLRRLPVMTSTAAGRAELGFDFGAPYASGVSAGGRFHFQAFFRDTLGGVMAVHTSDALEVVFHP